MKNKKQSHMNLTYKFLSEKDMEEGIVTGLGSKYGNTDFAGDIMMPNAFRKSINEKTGKFPILWQHEWSEPIGVIEEIQETNEGLKIKAKIDLNTQRGREAHSLAKMGALGGFSVGFMMEKFNMTKDGRRQITEGRLIEVSMVTFPCNEEAVIETVKGQFEGAATMNIKNLQDVVVKMEDLLGQKSVKVNKSDVLDLVREMQALLDSIIGSAKADEDELLDDSTSVDEATEEEAADEDVSNEASTEDEPQTDETADEADEETEKMLHSILANLTKK